MATIKITETALSGVKVLEPTYFEDSRGYYCETYSSRTLSEYGIDTVFRQDNHALSIKKGIIRGIHFQINPKPQLKLVRCIRGSVMDFAVDLRKDSPSYKKWVSVELSEVNRKQILIPGGFGHAYITLTEISDVLYKCDELYYPECNQGIAWNDPDIAIDWGTSSPIVSDKDAAAPMLRDCAANFTMKENNCM